MNISLSFLIHHYMYLFFCNYVLALTLFIATEKHAKDVESLQKELNDTKQKAVKLQQKIVYLQGMCWYLRKQT